MPGYALFAVLMPIPKALRPAVRVPIFCDLADAVAARAIERGIGDHTAG